MESLNYLAASIISFLGLAAGMILINIAPEEQKKLKKYLDFARKSLLVLMALSLFFFRKNFMISLLFLIISFFIEYRIKDQMKRSILHYLVFAAAFFYSSSKESFMLVFASEIFIYGALFASVNYIRKKNWHKIIFYNIGFVFLAGLLFFTI